MTQLRDAGSTRRWRALRRSWAEQLPLPCARCGVVIQYGEPFDLDHTIPRALGGSDEFARPSHPGCNRAANDRPFSRQARSTSTDRKSVV